MLKLQPKIKRILSKSKIKYQPLIFYYLRGDLLLNAWQLYHMPAIRGNSATNNYCIMEIINELRETIDREIEKMGFHERQPVELYRPVDYILSNGGKRIRPVISLMACRIFSDDITGCLGPALAIELFHNFTLLHDDIMDRADMRRGKPTVHKKWGENTAILSGDAMVVLSFEIISSSRNDILKNLLGIFNKMALEVC